MLDVGPGEFLVLAIAALFIFGPDRLPTIAKQAGRWVRDLRTMVANARRDLKDQTGIDTGEFQLSDLNPRSFVRRHLLDDEDLDLGLDDLGSSRDKPNGRAKAPGPAKPATTTQRPADAPPRYDSDAT